MSLRTQIVLSFVAIAVAMSIGSCESLRIGASTKLEPRPAAEACCAPAEAG
jgi:hypothetical protein